MRGRGLCGKSSFLVANLALSKIDFSSVHSSPLLSQPCHLLLLAKISSTAP
ncbi:hypothetical protein Sjap_025037 [Stephania japonica]|uniref:Uncharacterized protein n=1 Tax=Stephania japonica TaxID=461633 RepID=A0AAP0E131_9MAGN